MDDRTTGLRQPTTPDGWTIAAAIGGLMAVAFLIERIAPINRSGPQRPAKDLPLQSDTRGDAYPPGSPLKAETADVRPLRPPRSRPGDGRTSFGGFTAISATIAFWLWPPA